MFGGLADLKVGKIDVASTRNGGHPPEFWVERILARLVNLSDDAPPPIKAQAMAYKNAIREVLRAGVRAAIQSDRTTLIYELNKAGMPEAAELVSTTRR